MPRVFDGGPLEPVADPEVGDAALARDFRRAHHAARPAIAEPAGDQNAVRAVEQLLAARLLERFRFDPPDVDLQPVLEAAVIERLVQALVRVLVADVFADHVDGELVQRVPDAIDEVEPVAHLRFRLRQVQPPQDDAIEPFLGEHRRHLVDARDVLGGDDRLFVDVAEQRNLRLDVLIQVAIGAAEQDVGLDADRAQVAHAVLGRLGLQLPRRADERHERQVDVERVLTAHVLPELPDRLDERQALDVADRAPDLHEDDVDVPGDGLDRILDLVGDVRDDLHGAPQVIAAALLLDDREIDLAGRPVVVTRGQLVGEPLVVAQVQVGLRAVVGHIHFAVLIRAHRARVDVDVRVEFQEGDRVAMPLQERADGGRRQALAERGHDATGDEDVFDGPRVGVWHGRGSLRWQGGAPARRARARGPRACRRLSFREPFRSP